MSNEALVNSAETPTEEALRIARESVALQQAEVERARKAQAEHDAELAERGSLQSRMRDHFASVALNGILAAGFGDQVVPSAGFVAECSYNIAEAMLAERERRSLAEPAPTPIAVPFVHEEPRSPEGATDTVTLYSYDANGAPAAP